MKLEYATTRMRNDKQNKIYTWTDENINGMNYIIVNIFTLSYNQNGLL